MAISGLKVDGLRETRAALRKIAQAAKDLQELHADAAEVVEEWTAGIVPVLDGDLLATLRSSGTKSDGRVRVGNAGLPPYAGVINYGWDDHNIKAQKFMERGLDSAEPEVVDMFDERFDEITNKYSMKK